MLTSAPLNYSLPHYLAKPGPTRQQTQTQLVDPGVAVAFGCSVPTVTIPLGWANHASQFSRLGTCLCLAASSASCSVLWLSERQATRGMSQDDSQVTSKRSIRSTNFYYSFPSMLLPSLHSFFFFNTKSLRQAYLTDKAVTVCQGAVTIRYRCCNFYQLIN